MDQLTKGLLAAAKAFVQAIESENKTTEIQPAKPNATSNGNPVCSIHGKALVKSKKGPGMYCPTKDDNTGKWCPSRAN